jgi:hypothetical protein
MFYHKSTFSEDHDNMNKPPAKKRGRKKMNITDHDTDEKEETVIMKTSKNGTKRAKKENDEEPISVIKQEKEEIQETPKKKR